MHCCSDVTYKQENKYYKQPRLTFRSADSVFSSCLLSLLFSSSLVVTSFRWAADSDAVYNYK